MIDLSNDRRSVEIQILGYIRKKQIVPFRVLQHYSHIVTVEASGNTSNSNTPSNSSAADVKNGIDTSVDIDTILSHLNNLEAQLLKITDSSNAASIKNQVLEALRENISIPNGNVNEGSGTATEVASYIIPNNNSREEIVIQNKSINSFLYLRRATTADLTNSFCLPPTAAISFEGIKAKDRISVVTNTGETVEYYYEEVLM